MGILGWLILVALGGGAGVLLYQDLKDQEIGLWLYISFILFFILFTIIYNPLGTVFKLNSAVFLYKMCVVLLFLVILLFYSKRNKVAFADVLLIILTFILFPLKLALLLMIISSSLGLLVAWFTKNHSVGLVGIMTLLIVLFLVIGILIA